MSSPGAPRIASGVAFAFSVKAATAMGDFRARKIDPASWRALLSEWLVQIRLYG
jgi:hypothetical protein